MAENERDAREHQWPDQVALNLGARVARRIVAADNGSKGPRAQQLRGVSPGQGSHAATRLQQLTVSKWAPPSVRSSRPLAMSNICAAGREGRRRQERGCGARVLRRGGALNQTPWPTTHSSTLQL